MDLSKINPLNLGALVAGGLSFIFSLFSSYVTAESFGYSFGTNAWTSFATFGMLLVLAATALVAVRTFAPQVLPPGAPYALITAAVAGLGAILIILRAITAGDGAGPGWSGYVLFITTIALAVFAGLGFKESGEQLPNYGNNAGGQPPQPPAGPTPPAAGPQQPPAPPAGPTPPAPPAP